MVTHDVMGDSRNAEQKKADTKVTPFAHSPESERSRPQCLQSGGWAMLPVLGAGSVPGQGTKSPPVCGTGKFFLMQNGMNDRQEGELAVPPDIPHAFILWLRNPTSRNLSQRDIGEKSKAVFVQSMVVLYARAKHRTQTEHPSTDWSCPLFVNRRHATVGSRKGDL